IAAHLDLPQPTKPAKRNEIHRNIALNRSVGDNATMSFRRWNVHETTLCERTLGLAFSLLFLFFGEHLQGGIVESRVVLRRPLEWVDIPRSNNRLHNSRQLRLGIA